MSNFKIPVYRNKAILQLAKNHSCQHCGRNDGSTIAAHSNDKIHGRGLGLKSSDFFVAYLCFECHNDYDQKRERIVNYSMADAGRFLKFSQEDFNRAMFKTQMIILQHFELVKKG